MTTLGDFYAARRKRGQACRATRRVEGARLLRSRGVPFTSHNMGAHLVVTGRDGLIDFWPGTDKFITRDGVRGFGIIRLLELCNVD